MDNDGFPVLPKHLEYEGVLGDERSRKLDSKGSIVGTNSQKYTNQFGERYAWVFVMSNYFIMTVALRHVLFLMRCLHSELEL